MMKIARFNHITGFVLWLTQKKKDERKGKWFSRRLPENDEKVDATKYWFERNRPTVKYFWSILSNKIDETEWQTLKITEESETKTGNRAPQHITTKKYSVLWQLMCVIDAAEKHYRFRIIYLFHSCGVWSGLLFLFFFCFASGQLACVICFSFILLAYSIGEARKGSVFFGCCSFTTLCIGCLYLWRFGGTKPKSNWTMSPATKTK